LRRSGTLSYALYLFHSLVFKMVDKYLPAGNTVALGLLSLALVLLLTLSLVPLFAAVQSEIEQRRLLLKELAKLQGLVDAEPGMSEMLAKIDAHPMWQRLYLDPSVAAAESDLQKDFRALAETQGISVDTLQPLDPAIEKDFTGISLRVGFNTQIDHLGQLLTAMQAAPHFMKFENLYITSPMSQNGTGNAPLVVRGDVRAYLLAGQNP